MPNIDPVEDAYLKMREATRPNTEITDNRGPLVYELTQDASLNGVDPSYKNKAGGDVHQSRG